jgi:hypothetical protein
MYASGSLSRGTATSRSEREIQKLVKLNAIQTDLKFMQQEIMREMGNDRDEMIRMKKLIPYKVKCTCRTPAGLRCKSVGVNSPVAAAAIDVNNPSCMASLFQTKIRPVVVPYKCSMTVASRTNEAAAAARVPGGFVVLVSKAL